MFDIGIGEVLVILVVALLVFGPDRLPTMAKQAASFVRDLRTMVANARRDLSSSVGDLGIDEEDLRTLSDLRNPRSFVRKKVIDGADLGLDDLGLDDLGLDDEKNGKRTNGASGKARNGASGKTSRNGAAEKSADTDRDTPSAGSSTSAASSTPATDSTSAATSPSASSATSGSDSMAATGSATGSASTSGSGSADGGSTSGATVASQEPAPEAGATHTVANPPEQGDSAGTPAPRFDPDAT